MTHNWVKVFSTNQLYRAEMIKDILTDDDIPCVVINRQDSAYLFGQVEVHVPSESVIKALHLINSLKDE